MEKKSTFLTILLFFITSSAFSSFDKAIIGDFEPDWFSVTNLDKSGIEFLNSRSVGYLKKSDGRCTGFLISEDIVMTNHHCIENATLATSAKMIFNVIEGTTRNDWEKSTYECKTFIGNNDLLDYSLIRCDGKPGKKYGHLTLSETDADEFDEVYLIHQNCDYKTNKRCYRQKVISRGFLDPHPKHKKEHNFNHTADTLSGSSGAPIIGPTKNTVIGIHYNGYYENQNRDLGRGVINSAMKMNLIVKDIREKFPEIIDEISID
ncbi:MAG: hypothetical protein DRQ88_07280 [Epsilonproteobacteria bacterium]|nr:MAG: hypothetical protein DRQ89_03135 [Campylobacterota bacterium]RLA66284.1 MAG: hypothetical protein DRQ88_07280 [Campylobacterota bacterium]